MTQKQSSGWRTTRSSASNTKGGVVRISHASRVRLHARIAAARNCGARVAISGAIMESQKVSTPRWNFYRGRRTDFGNFQYCRMRVKVVCS